MPTFACERFRSARVDNLPKGCSSSSVTVTRGLRNMARSLTHHALRTASVGPGWTVQAPRQTIDDAIKNKALDLMSVMSKVALNC